MELTPTSRQSLFGQTDFTSLIIYMVLVIAGWLNIYAAVWDEAHASIFDLTQNYGKQLMWMGVAAFLGIVVLLIDDRFWHMFAYPLYWVMLAVLIGVALVGKEINGARSWIVLGPVALQPVELMKFATALALARYMSNYSFSIRRRRDLITIGAILMMPVLAILLQNDTGSAIVYGALVFMLYREGFNGWFYVAFFMAIGLFVGSFLFTPFALLAALVAGSAMALGGHSGRWREVLVGLAALAAATILVYYLTRLVGWDLELYGSLLVCTALELAVMAVMAIRARGGIVLRYIALVVASACFTATIDYVFDNVLQVHQQKRILDLLGIESDPQGWGYNVNQSKIAIGSGGLFGKGYLEGTQTKYNFVPEQSTDFIFCTVGEEWGFVGSAAVLALFCVLILRLMRMGERQAEPFGRVYCYSVASIFLAHVLVNVGMTIGLMPVIGIPLPFFSYGGSSLIAFSLMFFVAVKLDSNKRETNVFSITNYAARSVRNS